MIYFTMGMLRGVNTMGGVVNQSKGEEYYGGWGYYENTIIKIFFSIFFLIITIKEKNIYARK